MKHVPDRVSARCGPRRASALLVALCLSAACVTSDAKTGEKIPRGDQKYPFERVEKAADDLKVGMTKMQVLLTLGSPAEMDEKGSVWIYLPERYGILVPAKALRVQFDGDALTEYAFQTIVLGARL